MKCVACGSVALVEGTLIDNSGSRTSIFKPKELSIWKSMFGVGTREVRAYGCIHCQHLQLASALARRIRSVTSSLKASNRACWSE